MEEYSEELWEWINRDVPEEFWQTAGKIDDTELFEERLDEIPNELKPLAIVIIEVSMKRCEQGLGGKTPNSCMEFRHEAFYIVKEIKKRLDLDLKLPHYWYMDGVMIEPEWIVKLTNGIVGFTCDSSQKGCGIIGECRFYEEME